VDPVVEALQVLDVDRREHDARGEEVGDVLEPLLVVHAGGVRVRQFVDQGHGGRAGDHRGEVHVAERHAPVVDRPRGDDLDAAAIASVSARPWGSSHPMTTSRPSLRSSCPSSSMA